MNSRRWLIAPVVAAGVAMAAPAFAQGATDYDSGSWFFGVTAGRTWLDGTDQIGNRANTDLDGIPHNVTWDTTGTGYGARFGYRFNRYLAFDLDYTNFGSADGSYHTKLVPVSNGSFQLGGWATSLNVIGSLPLPYNFSVFGRAGLARDYMKVGMSGTGPGNLGTYTRDSYNWNGVYGVGAAYAFTQAISARIGYSIYNNAGGDDTGGSANVKYLYAGVDFSF